MIRPVLATMLLAAAALGCRSPEADRVRGGGPGADVGNRSEVVEIHDGARPYYRTPCAVSRWECTGPESVFGTDRTLD